MEERIFIKSITLSNGVKLKKEDDDFEDEILEYIPDNYIEYYAMRNLELNTEEYILNNAYEDDLIEALEDQGYNFAKQVDVEDCIDIIEREGYTVTYKDLVDDSLDIVDSNRLAEIQEMFISGNFAERENIYKLIMG